MLLNLKYENMLIVIQHDEVLSNANNLLSEIKTSNPTRKSVIHR